MATALNQDNAAMEAAAMVSALQNDDIDMRSDWVAGDLPERYAFREIDFRIDSNGHLQFGFRNSGLAQPLNGQTIEEVVETFRPTLAPAALQFESLPGLGALNALSLLVTPVRTPLDLDVFGDPIYIIYRFFKPRNITFSPVRKALSHKNAGAADRYGLLRHVGPIGSGPPSVNPVANCELVYFACMPEAVDYQDGFNLRVLLEQEPHLGPPLEPRFLDIEIDPDIRHPGGSET